MFAAPRWLLWEHLKAYAPTAELVKKLHTLGWKKVLGFHHGWNEAVIRQFYATLEVHKDSERLIWMTGHRRFEASYRNLATVVGVDYNRMMRGRLLVVLPLVLADDLNIPELFY